MIKLASRPLYTQEFDDPSTFIPEPGATYIFGVTEEDRSEFALQVKRRAKNVDFVELRDAERFVIETDRDDFSRVPLRRRSVVERFLGTFGNGPVYIDITGMSHSAWAALIKLCLERSIPTRIVYLEPTAYARNAAPRLGELYDLSEQIDGIEPLPLFVTLDSAPETQTCFVPLLGFEGPRFAHMLEEVQPLPRKTVPIVGIPGFQPDYPFYSFLGNATALLRDGAYRQVRFAKSNCPFSLYYTLEDIASQFEGDHIKIGLVGTKPHALGAVMFAICAGRSVELIFDHVRRKKNWTSGIDRCLVYGVSDFLSQGHGGPPENG